MFTASRPILLVIFLSVSLSASDNEVWAPKNIPTTGVMPFVLNYQQFLRENPFAIDLQPRTPEDVAENRRRHRQAADRYAAMAEIALRFAESGNLSPAAPADIEKKETERIRGSWNLYPNVPINAADLRQEALYMRFRALSHETSLDPNKINAMHDFVAGLENEPDLLKLFLTLKRNVCSRALSFAHNPLKKHIDKPDTVALPVEAEIGVTISVAVQWFVPFLQRYPNEDNMKLVDSFLDTIELFRSCYPNSKQTPEFVEPFRNALNHILNHFLLDQPNPPFEPRVRETGIEYATMYLGILRRWELLGKPMPIWGADLSGNQLDEKTLEGKVVLLDFLATWCGPCIAEFPHLKLLYQKYKDKGFEIVSCSVDDDQERLRDYLERNPLPWIVLSTSATQQTGLLSLSHYYGAKSLPVVVLRDQSGNALLLDAHGTKLDEVLERLFE